MSGKYFPELDLNTQVKMVLLYQLVYSNTLIHIWRFSTVRYDSVCVSTAVSSMSQTVTIFSGQSVISRVYMSRFGNATVSLEP